MSIQQLPLTVVKQISSAQVINSVSSAVKELLENSLDAGANIIDIKLDRNGLDKIEIRDNGAGISKANINRVCLPHCTSKIRNFDDLERLQSYGFRGEALYGLCAVSLLSITTKTENDEVASTYIFDNNGTVRETKPSHQMNGTTVTVTNLFKNIPVRRQFYEGSRKAAEELKRIEKVVKHLSIIHPKLRVTLAHNKCLIWHKTSVYSLRQSLMQVFSSAVLKNLKDVCCSFENMSVEMLIANRECNLPVLLQPVNEAVLLYINQRPVKDKKIEKVVHEEMNHLFASSLPVSKCPLTLLSLKLLPESLDVNLEPNKTKVFIKDHEEVLGKIREAIMRHFYDQSALDDTKSLLLEGEDLQNPSKKVKLQIDQNPSINENSDEISQMRDTIIENSNNDEMNLEALADMNLSVFNNREILHSTSSEQDVSSCFSLQRNTDPFILNGDKFVFPDKNVAISALNITKPQPSPKEDDLITNFSVDLDKSPSKLRYSNATDERQVVNMEWSRFSYENASFRGNENSCDVACIARNMGIEQDRPVSSNEKCTTDINDTASVDSAFTLSQWSKGHITRTPEPLKDGVILLNELKSDDDATMMTQQNSIQNDDNKSRGINRRLSSQMEHDSANGLTNFVRQTRSELVEEKSGSSFARVAKEVASRWNELRSGEKTSNMEESVKVKQKSIYSCKRNEIFKKKTLALTISVNSIFEELKMPGDFCQRSKDNRIIVIGPLESGEKWLYKFDDDLNIADISHLQENVLLHRYICNSSIPLKQLNDPIEISSQIIGKSLWNFIPTLDQRNVNDESVSIISDCRLTKNGFKLIIQKEYNPHKLLITEIANAADFNVVDNLVEVLTLAQQFKDLEHCRSEAIKAILMEKVAEVCQQKIVPKEAPELRILLQYWVQCMHQKKICPHSEPISVNLYKL